MSGTVTRKGGWQGGSRGCPILATAVMLGSTALASGHESYARREALSCSVCHVSDQGGPLTRFGREYLWRALPLSTSQQEEEESAASPATASPAWGRWSGESQTWLRLGSERVRGSSESVFSATESLRVAGDQLFHRDDLSFRGEVFGRSVLADHEGFDDDAVRLVSAELILRDPSGAGYVSAGRQWVTVGVGAHRVDGLAVHRRLGSSLEVDLYGGVPSFGLEGGASGDAVVGGRLGYLSADALRIGVSSVYAVDSSDPSEGKVGMDFLFRPVRQLDLTGNLSYDWIGEEFYDNRVAAVFKPTLRWQLAASYTRTVPSSFLPKNSIFSVFSVDDYEETALTVTHRMTERATVQVFDRLVFYDDGTHLLRVGARLDLRYGPQGEDAVGLEASYDDEERRRSGSLEKDSDALFLRVYHLLYWTEQIYSSLDASASVFASDRFARDAELVRLVLGYQPQASWDVQLGGEYGRNPEFPRRFDGFLRFTFRF